MTTAVPDLSTYLSPELSTSWCGGETIRGKHTSVDNEQFPRLRTRVCAGTHPGTCFPSIPGSQPEVAIVAATRFHGGHRTVVAPVSGSSPGVAPHRAMCQLPR